MRTVSGNAGFWVFLVALVLRLAWVVWRAAGAAPTLEFDDEALHWQLAQNLVGDGILATDDGRYAARMPLYPLFLALFAWRGPGGILAARLAQAVIGAITAWLVYRFAQEALGRRPGLIAGLLAACDPYSIFFCNLLLTEVLFTLAGVGLTYTAWMTLRRPHEISRRGLVALALLGPIAILTRPSAAAWIPLIWLVLWLFSENRIRAAYRMIGLGLVCVALLLPWGLRNRLVIGSYAWLSTNGGVTLYDAQGPQATGASDQSFLQHMPELAALDEVQVDRRLGALARRHMWHDPYRVVRLAGVKFARTWNPRPNYEQYRGGLAGLVSAAFMLPVIVASLVGVFRLVGQLGSPSARRRRRLLIVLLWLPIAYFTLVHCIYIGSLRYRVPLMPFMIISAAAAFVVTHDPVGTARGEGRLWTKAASRQV